MQKITVTKDEDAYDFNKNGKIDTEEKTYWYWIGEDTTYDYRPCPGIYAYISNDLLNWVDIGCVLKTVDSWETFTTDKYFTDLYGDLNDEQKKAAYADIWTNGDSSDSGCVIERPKMLYSKSADQYVIWFHADGQTPDSQGANYGKAKAGIATSKSPFGPFKMKGSYLLASDPSQNHDWDHESGHVRDMNLFKDDDGTAYVMYSSEANRVMYIARLNDSYDGLAKDREQMVLVEDFCISSTDSREAPAMFKYNNKYYLVTSGCTGWSPNQAAYAVADNPLGPWTRKGDPCEGDTDKTTFHTQSTCVIPVDPTTGKYIYMGDRWSNPDTGNHLRDSRYVWLPVEFTGNNGIVIKDYSDWSMDVFNDIEPFNINTELPNVTNSWSDLKANLPAKVSIKYASQNTSEDVDVTWTVPTDDSNISIDVESITGEFTKNGKTRSFTHTVTKVKDNLIYFFDCAAESSDSVNLAKEYLGKKLRNENADQAYSEENKAGYTSTDDDMGSKVNDMNIWEQGYWAKSDKSISYAFDLRKGTYTVSTGYYEWWNDSSRNMKVVVLADNKELTSTVVNLKKAAKCQKDVTFILDSAAKVTVSVSKEGNSSDPVLSWIAVAQDSDPTETWKEEIAKITENVEEGKYTTDTWEEYSEKLDAANTLVNGTYETDWFDIDAEEAVEALKVAKDRLKTIKEYLQERITEITADVLTEDKYTADTWKEYSEKLNAANTLINAADLTEAKANDTLEALKTAKAGLKVLAPYNITYDLDGGTVTQGNKTTYTEDDADFTLNNPVKDDYIFIGWTGNGIIEPTLSMIIKKGTKGDLQFKANWRGKIHTVLRLILMEVLR